MGVSLRLLGRPAWRVGGAWSEVPPLKTTAVLLYLAVRNAWVDRAELVYLLWPDVEEGRARRNLRQLLTKVRRLEHAEGLEVERSRIRWLVDSDLHAFRDALGEGRRARAAELYAGPLLQGFHLSDAPEFENWLAFERQELHAAWRGAVLGAAGELEANGRDEAAAELLGRLVASDPLDEDAVRQRLAGLHRAGRRSEALQAYRAFRDVLREEMAVEPDPSTTEVADRIERGERTGSPAAGEARRGAAALPTPPTPFVGRSVELEHLLERVDDPSCRLLSLVGPGGSGKTRLALEVACRRAGAFGDGARFVSLASLRSAEWMVPAIADALDVTSFGAEPPKRQLLQHLRERELLLVLDNLEHLTDGVDLLTEILEVAPGVMLLATSRQRLELRAEWVVDVDGLQVSPVESDDADSQDRADPPQAQADGPRLFAQAAARARADVAFEADDWVRVARICHALGGMPLAIELAADWVRALSLEQIEEEVAGGLDLLASPARDVPDRHRSLRTVFDQSWRLLSEAERSAMRKLSVFRGGFTRNAAASVADASLPVLLALANKSLLRTVRAGRFERHPLVWQYTDEQARAIPSERAAAKERHARYFAQQLRSFADALNDERAVGAYQRIETDIDNVRAAWTWAAEEGREDVLDAMLTSLATYLQRRARGEEGRSLMRAARRHLPEGSLVHGRLTLREARFAFEPDRDYESAETLVRAGVKELRRHDAPWDLALGLEWLGFALMKRHRTATEKAREALEESLAIYRALGDANGVAMTLNKLAFPSKAVEASERQLREAAHVAREGGVRWSLAMTLESLAQHLMLRAGRHTDAARAAEESVEAFRFTGDLNFMVPAVRAAGDAALAAGDTGRAEARYCDLHDLCDGLTGTLLAETRALAIDRRGWIAYLKGDIEHAATACARAREHLRDAVVPLAWTEVLTHLGRIALVRGRNEEAAHHLEEALETADEAWDEHDLWGPAAHVATCTLAGEVALARGDPGAAATDFDRALGCAQDRGLLPEALRTLVGVARLAAAAGDEGRTRDLLVLVLQHPGAPYDVRVEARRASRESRLDLSSDRLELGGVGDVVRVCRLGREVLRGATSREPFGVT